MAAVFVYGVDGAISLGGKLVSYVNSWSMAIGTGVADTPSLGSSGPVRTYAKYHDFSGNVTGSYRYDPATSTGGGSTHETAQDSLIGQFVSAGTPAAVVATFVESTASNYYGRVVLTNFSKNQSAEGVGTWSADWAQSNGPLKWKNATTT